MKLYINKLTLILFIVTIFTSCDDKGYDKFENKKTDTAEMNGEWYIDIIDEASGDVLVQHTKHITYDSNMGDGKMFINDFQNGYYLGGLVNTDTKSLTFSTTDEENFQDPGSTFNITEGKILKGMARSKNGTVVDSIYFKGEFSYDPGTIIIFAGHKRTGFLEDEY